MNPTNRLNPTKEQVQTNYAFVVERVAAAARRSSRNPSDVKIVAVTKYVDTTIMRWLLELGCSEFGESRPQVLWEKAALLENTPIHWHLVGHLQRNKAKRTLPFVSDMHSLDSMRLLEQIQLDTAQRETPLRLLLEMNVSGDAEKTGMSVTEGEELLKAWQTRAIQFPKLEIVGLMGMGSLSGGSDQARQDFEALRNLRDRWELQFGMALKELSMGMSNDYEAAIEEGATMVRIGSILFS